MSRRLVTIRPVKDKKVIPKADKIERLIVDGWNVVSQVNNFQVGDYGVFFEVDSGLPVEDARFSFMESVGRKDFHGKIVYRVKTIRLRGTLSQGLMMPLDMFPEIIEHLEVNDLTVEDAYQQKIDFAELLDVVKYEPPLKIRGADSAGNFPFWIRKTDQERINNVFDEFNEDFKAMSFFATYKMNGSSATYAYITDIDKHIDTLETDDENGQFFVCSRTQTLKDSKTSPFHVAADTMKIKSKLKDFHEQTGRNIAIQGELLGRGIQGTIEKIYDYTVHFFSVYDIDNQEYLPFSQAIEIFNDLQLKTVQVYDIFEPFIRFDTVDDFIEYSDNLPPIHADIPEGIVYHSCSEPVVSFKAISSKFLLKYE